MTNETQSSKNELAIITSAVGTSVSLSKPQSQNEMVNQAMSVVVRPDFIKEISDEVGEPLDGETRDDYINRAQNRVVQKLTSLLG